MPLLFRARDPPLHIVRLQPSENLPWLLGMMNVYRKRPKGEARALSSSFYQEKGAF